MTIIERERILTDAARRYLAGEISYAELTRIRRAIDRPAPERRDSDAAD